ncbi:hypothetical protein Tco_1182221 [Tanacetum coccineum]|uniref:Uncharacterized protein n=1 Tax=Tanacetum coccineum TaxID=301880 RepID=A0ABQ5BVC2_9ASTR
MGFRMELVQGATPICEGSCRLTSLERQEEASVLLGRKKGCVMDTLKFTATPFGLTNAPGVFMDAWKSLEEERCTVKFSNNVEAGSKEEASRCGRNHMGWSNEPILALPERSSTSPTQIQSEDFKTWRAKEIVDGCYLVMLDFCGHCIHLGIGKMLMLYVGLDEGYVQEKIAVNNKKLRGLDHRVVKRMESGSYWLDKVRTSIWRDVRTLAIEEAYTTKYSIYLDVDKVLCSLGLTNRWLSMKKDIASCGSKYLAYLEVEVEYQGSSGLLLQPELPEVDSWASSPKDN